MPATDRLLHKLQETLGEGPTHDLVSWVNEAGTVNVGEVRQLADLYLGRLDERMDRRFAEHDAKLDQRFAEYDVKLDRRFAEYDVKLERRFAEYDARMAAGFAALRVEMADRLSTQFKDTLRWLFVFWAGTIIPLAGLMVALVKH